MYMQKLKIMYSLSTEVMSDGKLSLFMMGSHISEFLLHIENINQHCFYGRCLGFQVFTNDFWNVCSSSFSCFSKFCITCPFQFCDGLRNILKTLSFCMASFSEMYYNNGTVLERCANSVKYLLDPEARARRVVNIFLHADISFCQAFWFLNESSK